MTTVIKVYCKQQLKDRDKSTWNNTVYRGCKLEAKKDGYCMTHNPEAIDSALEHRAACEMLDDVRESERIDEAIVGKYMRLKLPEQFDSYLKEVKAMEDLIKTMRS